MQFLAHRLSWRDVDPATHPFDAEAVAPAIAPIVEAAAAEHRPDRARVERDIDAALIRHFGAWIAGWNWSASEPGGGGPVQHWCCPRDSILVSREGAQATIERVVRATTDWRAFLERLAHEQSSLAAMPRLPIEEQVERAVAIYTALVVERTQTSDAWYATVAATLCWHLQSLGLDDDRGERAAFDAVRGHFDSWIAPDPSAVKAAALELGVAVADLLERSTAETPPDGLVSWRRTLRRSRSSHVHRVRRARSLTTPSARSSSASIGRVRPSAPTGCYA